MKADDRDRTKLLFGPYEAPRLRKGDRAACLYRDCEVVVTGWAGARINWPRCRPVDVSRARPSLLVDEELARAVRHESAAALRYWWGVSEFLVWKWRKALGVNCRNCLGTQRLLRAASGRGAAQVRGKELPPEQVERRRRTARGLNLSARVRASRGRVDGGGGGATRQAAGRGGGGEDGTRAESGTL